MITGRLKGGLPAWVDETIGTTLFVVISNDAYVDDEFVIEEKVNPDVIVEFDGTEDDVVGTLIVGVDEDVRELSVVDS